MSGSKLFTDRKEFFLLGVIVLTLLISVSLYSAVSNWNASQDAIEDAAANLRKMKAIASFDAAKSGFDAKPDYGSAFLADGPSNVQSATLITKLKELANTSHVQVQSANSLSEKREGSIAWVGANLQATSTWPAVLDLLQKIDQTEPLLFVDRMTLRSLMPPGAEQNQDTILQIDLDVLAAAHPQEAPGQQVKP